MRSAGRDAQRRRRTLSSRFFAADLIFFDALRTDVCAANCSFATLGMPRLLSGLNLALDFPLFDLVVEISLEVLELLDARAPPEAVDCSTTVDRNEATGNAGPGLVLSANLTILSTHADPPPQGYDSRAPRVSRFQCHFQPVWQKGAHHDLPTQWTATWRRGGGWAGNQLSTYER